MTDSQKKQIASMRNKKATYTEISEAMGIPVGTIKNYCYRYGMTAKTQASKPSCKNCGTELIHASKARPRLFCCEHCKQTWWNKHRRERASAKIIPHTCPMCGKVFADYSGANRKYCSQKCYHERKLHDGP